MVRGGMKHYTGRCSIRRNDMARKRKRKYRKKDKKFWGSRCTATHHKTGHKEKGGNKPHPTPKMPESLIPARTTSMIILTAKDELRLYRIYYNLDGISCSRMSPRDRNLLNIARNDIEEVLNRG